MWTLPDSGVKPRGSQTNSINGICDNCLLSFALDLDPGHPYLVERGVPGIVIMPFGLGYCGKGIMAGRLCIPTNITAL
jgi:hypothetical protein